jgi:ribosomal protein S18 acetylase RimI-like enzyme
MQFVDKALARRLESAEEMPQVEYANYYARIRPEIGAAVEQISGGHMIFAGLNSPIGRAVGMGFSAPVTAEELDRLEGFYRSKGAPAQLDYTPLSDPSLLELTKERGYGIAELNNVLFRALDQLDPLPKMNEFEIRSTTKDDAKELSSIVARSFFEKGDMPEGFGDLISPMYEFAGSITYGVAVDGKYVAAGAGLVIPEHRIFALFGAGTLPEYRGRGIQSALLLMRLHAARQAGCDYAVIVTLGGTTSERNCVRLGFRTAYSKATLIKKLADS